MNLQGYLQKRELEAKNAPYKRTLCLACRQPTFTCFCRYVEAFDSGIRFVILIHDIEFKRRIATGRLSHLCLKNSEIIRGTDYSQNTKVNELLNDSNYHSVIMYPGPKSKNLTSLKSEERDQISPDGKPLQIVVIDGTWNTARKMLRLSTNLHRLPRVCFTPEKPSRFRVRKQHQFGLQSSMDLPGRVQFDLGLRYVDSLPEISIPSYVELDARLAWRPSRNVELSIVGQNLLHGSHLEFKPTTINIQQTEVQRGVYAKITFRF